MRHRSECGSEPSESASDRRQSEAEKGGAGRLIGLTRGGHNTKLHAVTDHLERPIRLLLTAGQVSDYTGARQLLDALPRAKHMLADRGYDADWFRKGLKKRGISPCIPSRKNRKSPIPHDEERYKDRNKVEIMFGRLKDWRRIAMRFDKSPTVFLSAVTLAAIVLFWL